MPLSEQDLIPRPKFFGNPSRISGQISPNGEMVSWLAPDEGVLNIWVAPRDSFENNDPDAARAITNDRLRGIRMYGWAKNNDHIFYIQDEGGNEDWHLYCVNITKNTIVDLTPYEGVTAQIIATSWQHPNEIIVGLNDRDASWHDLYRINIQTGARELILLNENEFSSFTVDDDFTLRFAEKALPEGGRKIFRVTPNDNADEAAIRFQFEDYLTVPLEDDLTTHIVNFEADNTHLYMVNSIGRNTSELLRINDISGAREQLGSSQKADINDLLPHPVTRKVQAYSIDYLRNEWHVLDDMVKADLEFLKQNLNGEIDVVSHNKEDSYWIITAQSAEQPTMTYLYDRGTQKITLLFAARPELEGTKLSPLEGHIIPSRDGLELVSYLTRAKVRDGVEPTNALVLLVHGGPWARDHYGYDPVHQWLSDRGYSVLSVNFRGSTGFGKNFINAADLEWGGKMHDDLLDAVQWAIDQKIAAPDKVAIMGGSYGGYATLAGLAFTPHTFACGVDIVGPSNLQTLLETIPPYWQSFYETFAKRVGDPRTSEGEALLKERSPLYKAQDIARPLLIGQGANDPRVKQSESDQIVGAMQKNNLPVTYALYPDEGHGFARPENRLSFYALTELFLSAHLGGLAAPFGNDLENSSLLIPLGPEHIPNLPDVPKV